MSATSLQAGLTRLARRSQRVEFARGLLATSLVVAFAMELVWVLRGPVLMLGGTTAALGLAISAWRARERMPSLQKVARDADRLLHTNDLIITALERRNASDAVSRAVVSLGSAALSPQSSAVVYPLRGLARPRRWLAVGVLVQLVMAILTWQTPSARQPADTLSSLALPGGADATGAQSSPSQRSSSTPASAGGPAAAAAPSTSIAAASTAPPTSSASAFAQTSRTEGGAVAPTAVNDSIRPGDTPAAATSETTGDAARYRQAAARAAAAATQGRVPLTMRGIVERYFASMQTPGERRHHE